MKTWQVDTTANHSFPQKKEGVFGGNSCKTLIDLKQMLSCGKNSLNTHAPNGDEVLKYTKNQ